MKDAWNLRRWLAIAILTCAALYLIGNGQVPLWDRDEGWYAQCSKQMWETGDWVVPRFLDNLRTEKPVFVYWLQLGGYALFGGPSEFAVRFYAAIAQVAVLCILGFTLFKLAGPRRGVWTAFIYGTCVMAIISAKMCLTDATLMVFVLTAQLCLMSFYLGRFRWSILGLMLVALGFGGLTKGPVALIPSIMTLVVLGLMDWRRWVGVIRENPGVIWKGSLIVVGGLLITVSVSVPWLLALHQREPRWLPAVLGTSYEHLTQPMDGHKGPFGYYMALIWGTYFPWSLLIPTAAYVAWKQRHVAHTRFAIAAFVGPWLFFEFMKTKLPHYPLPTYPFLSLLVADAIVRCSRGQYREFVKLPFQIGAGIWALPIGLLASAPWLALLAKPELSPLPYAAMTVVSIAGLVFSIGTWWFFFKRRPVVACAYMGGSFVVLIALTYGWLIPQADYLRTSPRVAAILRDYDGTADRGAKVGEVASIMYPTAEDTYGYAEPTLDYYQGGTIRPIEVHRYLETTAPEKWPRLMVITDQVWSACEPGTREQLEVLGSVRGFLYSSGGDIVDVMVVRRKAQLLAGDTRPSSSDAASSAAKN